MLAPELARSFCDGGPFRVWLDCLARDLTVNPAGSLSSMLVDTGLNRPFGIRHLQEEL